MSAALDFLGVILWSAGAPIAAIALLTLTAAAAAPLLRPLGSWLLRSVARLP